MRIAVVQVRDAPPDVEANLETGLARVAGAAEAGAGLIVFPELFLTGYYLDQAMVGRAGAADAALARLHSACERHGLTAVVGAPHRTSAALLNSLAVLAPGAPVGWYDKTHLFPPERDWFDAGDALWNGDLAGWPCGLEVCYEVGFPEVARCLTLRGARLLIVSAAFGRLRTHIWETATVARALENGVYLAAAGQAGTNGVIEFAGRSRVVDPTGHVVAEAGDDDALLVADLDEALVDDVRGGGRTDACAYLRDRRPELYGPLSGGGAGGAT
jgi:predicted amidohydrolase